MQYPSVLNDFAMTLLEAKWRVPGVNIHEMESKESPLSLLFLVE
jgi:hypothetical protein